MHDRRFSPTRAAALLTIATAVALAPQGAVAQPSSEGTKAFNTYTAQVESRLVNQHRAPQTFLARIDESRLRSQPLIEHIDTPQVKGALLHHWRGTAFAPNAQPQDFERLMQNFAAYPQIFSPEVLWAKLISRSGDHGELLQASMRVREHHILTVVMDTAYDIAYGRLDLRHAYSISRSTSISELANPGTAAEHPLTPSQEHGFLYRTNTYWSYEERDNGLYLQIESISLTRSIPAGLGWAVRPFVESVPRETLEFTLRSTCQALKH